MIFQDGQKHVTTSVLRWVQGGMRRTALHWACQRGDVKCVEALVAAGADTTVRAAQPRAPRDAQQG
jgi:Ankyrin repeat